MTAKAVSLAGELAVLARGVQGVADLLDIQKIGPVPEDQRREALAMLCVLDARLWQLRRTVVGAQDPATLLASHNEAEEPRPGDDPDILLHPWPEADTARPRRRKKGQ